MGAETSPVVIIDRPLARTLWPDGDALGQHVRFLDRATREPVGDPVQVVGIVPGVRQELFDPEPVAHVYVPLGQGYRSAMTMHVRIAGVGREAEALMMRTLRQEIRAADPNVPLLALETYRQFHEDSLELWAVRAAAKLFSTFGAVALLLAVIGVYGVKAYVVSGRTARSASGRRSVPPPRTSSGCSCGRGSS